MELAGGRRVVAGVSGTLGSLTALHRAAAEARRTDAVLRAVLAWSPPGGELGHRSQPWPELLTECRRVADDRLLRAVDTAFGPAGPGVPMETLVVRGTPGLALIAATNGPEDLLVVGAGAWGAAEGPASLGRPVLSRARDLPRARRTALSAAGRHCRRPPPDLLAHAAEHPGVGGLTRCSQADRSQCTEATRSSAHVAVFGCAPLRIREYRPAERAALPSRSCQQAVNMGCTGRVAPSVSPRFFLCRSKAADAQGLTAPDNPVAPAADMRRRILRTASAHGLSGAGAPVPERLSVTPGRLTRCSRCAGGPPGARSFRPGPPPRIRGSAR